MSDFPSSFPTLNTPLAATHRHPFRDEHRSTHSRWGEGLFPVHQTPREDQSRSASAAKVWDRGKLFHWVPGLFAGAASGLWSLSSCCSWTVTRIGDIALLYRAFQPLADNLQSTTYQTFEQDPVKYASYEEATFMALLEWPKTDDRMWVVPRRLCPIRY